MDRDAVVWRPALDLSQKVRSNRTLAPFLLGEVGRGLVVWGSKTAGLGGVARIGENLRAPEGLGFGVGFSGFPARWYYHFVFLRYRIAKPLGV